MIPQNNCFVSNPGYLARVKCTRLRKLMMLGSCPTTPLEKKATFNWSWQGVEGKGDFVTSVTYFPPNSHYPSETFNLNEQTRIPLAHWYSIMSSVQSYPEFIEEQTELARVRDIVKRFEEAAKRHGATQQAVALGHRGEQHAYETGKALKTLREELYEELGV